MYLTVQTIIKVRQTPIDGAQTPYKKRARWMQADATRALNTAKRARGAEQERKPDSMYSFSESRLVKSMVVGEPPSPPTAVVTSERVVNSIL